MKYNFSNIKKAKSLLDKYDCVAIPTETVYGLAANAYSDIAVKKIFKLKKRPPSNPLIVHYFSLRDLKKDCKINDLFLKLFKRFSPGPITYILKLKRNSRISKIVTNKKMNLAVRFPKHQVTRKLLKSITYPLAAPSANISSKLSPVCSQDVKDDFGEKIKFILNGGRSLIGMESTIVDLTGNPKILRLGGLEVSKISQMLNKNLDTKLNSSKNLSPGQMKLHYSPGLPLRLNVKKPKKSDAYVLLKKSKKFKKNVYILSKNGSLKEAAKNLYKTLRKIKKDKFKSISVEKIQDFGLGKTINDRLIRASKFNG